MADAGFGEGGVFLSDVPASRGECRLAGAIVAGSTFIFLMLAPFAKLPLAPLPVFIPIYQSALVINDLITVVFLLGQSQFAHSRALSLLACGYLFTALISTVHALTFPGLFSPTGLIGAGPQTTAWLYVFWHAGFPAFVIAYAISAAERQRARANIAALVAKAGLVLAAVIGFALVATLGRDALPAILLGNHYTPAATVVLSAVWTLNLAAALVLSRRRPYSVLDLWLMVVMCAWLFDIALSAMLNAGRFDLGFYAGRIYGLAAASLVLILLLCGNSRLYLQLIKLHRSEREKAVELQRLSTVDALTGIANRRVFDEALTQEWRRMLRHGEALSLLMIDVDYFKRFNDAYGHVAGDQCLRAVAQAVASRARRAGEVAARYGGEEFAVLLPHTDIAEARRLAEVICAAVRDCRVRHAHSMAAQYVTISVGVACMAEVPDSAAAFLREGAAPAAFTPGATVLVEAADHALYQAKMAGRNQVVAAGEGDALDLAAPSEIAAAVS
jgi:diguanylate cyclase (GGDEF)-like protein